MEESNVKTERNNVASSFQTDVRYLNCMHASRASSNTIPSGYCS
jgi:hypothetical protein